jgi:hypothetical protein
MTRVRNIEDPFTGETWDGPSYDAGYRDGIEHQRQLQAVTIRAAEAAVPVTDAGLDVERLARAMAGIWPMYDDVIIAQWAKRIAALSRQAEKETA